MTIVSINSFASFSVVGLLSLSLHFSPAHAETNRNETQKEVDDTRSSLKINGELGVGAWSSSRLLNDQQNFLNERLTLNASTDVTEHIKIRIDGWAYHSRNAEDGRSIGRLRDAYLRWDGEATELRVGPQVFAWGRADRINPTDNLTARDYTAPFATDDDQRYGAMAASLSEYIGANRFNFIVKTFRPSIAPNDANEQRLGVRGMHDDLIEYAAKLDHTGDQFDWSVSYFHGREKLRSLQIERQGNLVTGISRGYAPLEAVGFDGAYTMGAWGLRGELAHLRFEDTDFINSAGRLSHWFGVIGAERSLDNSATVNLQYYFRHFATALNASTQSTREQQLHADIGVANNQLNRYQHGISLRYAQRLWNDRLDYELVGLVNFRERDFAVRPRLNVRYSDRIKFTAGVDEFRGDARSYFGSLKKNSLAFAEVVFIY